LVVDKHSGETWNDDGGTAQPQEGRGNSRINSMQTNPYESPQEPNAQVSGAHSPTTKQSSPLRQLIIGWIVGGFLAGAWCFTFVNPLMSHIPTDKVTMLLVLLGAVIGGGISRRLG
jgi:hypothetical protein